MQHANSLSHTDTHLVNVGNAVDHWGGDLLFCVCVNLDVMSSGSDGIGFVVQTRGLGEGRTARLKI